jgi:hypothetical protein
MARGLSLQPDGFLARAAELREIVEECLVDGGQPVTLYS